MKDYIKNIASIYFIRKLNENEQEAKQIQKIITRIVLAVDLVEIETEGLISESNNPLLVSIGGDGTALYGMKLSASLGIPLITINLGRLGFLADLNPVEIEKSVLDILAGNFVAEDRLMLESLGSIAANEFFIGPLESGTLFHYKIYVDGILASKQEADGVIISTPTGSTGYAMSTGGALIAPEIKAIQIIPVSAHTLSSRPLVVKYNKRISVTFENQEAILKADGRKIKTFDVASCVDINAYPDPAVILHPVNWNFYSVLSEKLGWNL